MKKLILTLCYLAITILINAQSPKFEWAKSMGGPSADIGVSAIDASGNVYTTGFFVGTVDFDPGIGNFNFTSHPNSNPNLSSPDMYISKLDASGNFLWAKQIGDTEYERGQAIVVDITGNVYTTGTIQGVVDFDPGPGIFNLGSPGGMNIFILKLDAAGNFVWAKAVVGSSSSRGNSISVDVSGNIYTAGTFDGTADFNPGFDIFNLTAIAKRDAFILKLNSSGNFVWAKNITSLGENDVSSAVDAFGNVFMTGRFEGVVDVDPGGSVFNLTAAGSFDIFILKLYASGNFAWAKSIGGTSYDWAFSVATDKYGSIYTTGYFHDTVDFDPGAGIFNLTSGNGVFISKLNADGNFVWAKNFGGRLGSAIKVDSACNIYATGSFSGTVDFDPELLIAIELPPPPILTAHTKSP